MKSSDRVCVSRLARGKNKVVNKVANPAGLDAEQAAGLNVAAPRNAGRGMT